MREIIGYAISVSSYRLLNDEFQVRTKVFVTHCGFITDAESWALEQNKKNCPPSEGWKYIASSVMISVPMVMMPGVN